MSGRTNREDRIMRRLATFLVFLGMAGVCQAKQPWEIKTTGGYLSGSRIVASAAGAQQFHEAPERGQQRFLTYDKEGSAPIIDQGEASLWEFESRGPGEFYIKAAE